MNEVDFLITSRNLYMKKGEESLDIGLFSNINENRDIFFKIKDDLRLFAHNSFKNIKTSTKNENNSLIKFGMGMRKSNIVTTKNDGFCIRCGKPIPFNPDMPYCSSCFPNWSQTNEMKHLENHCHKCGHLEEDISMARPLCFSCWKDWKDPRVIPF